MSKMVHIHPLKLKPDTNIEEFERFVVEELSQYVWKGGSSHRVVKYESGIKSAQYLLIFERSEAFYNATEEERQKIHDETHKQPGNAERVAKLKSYTIDLFSEGTFTHYITLG